MSAKELERKSAIARYRAGESASGICRSLNRPRKWLYKWLARANSGGADWFADASRQPRHCPARTPAEISAQVVAVRQELAQTRYAGCGVFALRQGLAERGLLAIPSDSTLQRISRRAGLVQHPSPRQKVGTPYPAPPADTPNALHQLDLWGPRYLGVGRSCYIVNIIDVARRMPSIHPLPDKSFASLIPALVRCWQTLGLPGILQLDNAWALGTSIHPGCICKFLRLCLHVGVHVLFVPFAEPWRQGVVEKFNDFLAKQFFATHRFADLTELCCQAGAFQQYCHQRRLPALRGQTPAGLSVGLTVLRLAEDFAVNLDSLPIPAGRISFIRLVRSDRRIDVLGRKFPVDERYYREYVTARLCTGSGVLAIYHQEQQIAQFQFSMCSE